MAIKRTSKTTESRIAVAIRELQEFADHVEKHGTIPPEMTVRTYTRADLPRLPKPRAFSRRKVRALRAQLGVSQQVFADLLGVSHRLVCHWEQGLREPSPLARRMLETMERDPKPWMEMLQTAQRAGTVLKTRNASPGKGRAA